MLTMTPAFRDQPFHQLPMGGGSHVLAINLEVNSIEKQPISLKL